MTIKAENPLSFHFAQTSLNNSTVYRSGVACSYTGVKEDVVGGGKV